MERTMRAFLSGNELKSNWHRSGAAVGNVGDGVSAAVQRCAGYANNQRYKNPGYQIQRMDKGVYALIGQQC